MRAACIDIGSNTTRLLVGDCDGRWVNHIHQERAFTRIGPDVGIAGQISSSKLAEVGEVVAAQLGKAREHGAEQIRCVATAAVRRASNRADLVHWIHRRCDGLDVQVLAEQEEAELAFLGAARSLRGGPGGPLGLIDVGGGSSELVVGDANGTVRWWASVPIGSGDLTARFVRDDPPSTGELERIRRHVEEVMGHLQPPRAAMAVAVGGSATSLLPMSGRVLDERALDRALEMALGTPAAEVARQTGLDVERAGLLPAGLVILREAVNRFEQPLLVGSGGLREGVLLRSAGR